jgi:hypothetical protein
MGAKMRCMNADAKRSLSDLRGWRNALIYGLRGATSANGAACCAMMGGRRERRRSVRGVQVVPAW